MPLGRAALLLSIVLAGIVGCSPRVGDRLLSLPESTPDADECDVIATTLDGVAALLDQFPVPAERKRWLTSLKPSRIIRNSQPLDLGLTSHTIVLARADVQIGFASHSVIIAAGAVRIAHSENNVVVSGRDVAISHDGSQGTGSLVVSKGSTRISHARNTLIYAGDGVEVSFATDVRAFNTEDREASWGRIDNTVVAPLFQK